MDKNFQRDDKSTIDVINSDIEKLELIEKKMGLQNTNLQNKVLLGTKNIIDSMKSEKGQYEEVIKENSGLFKSIQRLIMELRLHLFGSVGRNKYQGLDLSGSNIKSFNSKSVEICGVNADSAKNEIGEDKDIEVVEQSHDSILVKIGDKTQNIISVENKNDVDKMEK